MKILVLNGSPKRDQSDTMHITRAFLEGMKEAAPQDIHIIHTIDRHIEYCTGCFSCMRNGGTCIHDDDMILEHYARNTRENATYSIAILDSLGHTPEQCLIVTSATHLKRSLACFEAEGWTIDGYATNIYPKPHPKLYQFLPQWKPLTDWKELLNEWFGSIVYKTIGY